jgi:bifunctional enzyme CysN/CysC
MGESQLSIVIVGHVDHGKSTFIGRLFHDTGSLPEGKLEQLQMVAQRRGVPFEWANLMDALQSERDQNITIDTAQIWFRTQKRAYVIIDAPGHQEFLKNMITGAAQAEAALLLIDAAEGIQEQSRRHGYLLHLIGVRQIAVLVNKMDLVEYSQARFEELERDYRAFLVELGIEARFFLPMSARHGHNVAVRSPELGWWPGPTVLEALDSLEGLPAPDGQPLRFPIQDIYRFDERRILAGRVEAGTVKVGDRLLFSPGNKHSTVRSIERWSAPLISVASAGECIGLTLTEQVFVERGAVACHADGDEREVPYELNRFRARVFWLGRDPLVTGKAYKIKLVTQESECEVESFETIIDASTLDRLTRSQARRHEVAELTLRTRRPLAFDVHDQIVATGRFVLVDGYEVCGGGIIVDDNYPRRRSEGNHKSKNIFWSSSKIDAGQRAWRNGHSGAVVWLTGLSGSGKSTIAIELERQLFNAGQNAYILDGDNIRHGLCSDLGFSHDERTENIRRVGEVARLFADAGLICITAFISPYASDRDQVRRMLAATHTRFVEVFLNTPLEVCERRDPKGLYARARAHQIKDFTGISAPYEVPLQPELELHSGDTSVGESVERILAYLSLL